MKPKLLDLYCGEGGAAMGYHRAGFDVFGVDVRRDALRYYPFPHHRGDALSYLDKRGHEFDAIHASPPCKVHTALTSALAADDFDSMLFPVSTHSDLIPQTRAAVRATGLPYVIENVPGAPLESPLVLCGSQFDLGVDCEDEWRQLRRHRLFESNMSLTPPGRCAHRGDAIGVYGLGGRTGGRWQTPGRRGAYQGTLNEARLAIGAPWMSRAGLSQSIPPAYTEHIGLQLLAAERSAA
jgi:DNA (cytosine-5)-methyltransferase 1